MQELVNSGPSDFLSYEKLAWAEGYLDVSGVDEAGRGALAGPVVAAALILPRGVPVPAVRDSKQLSPAQRTRLAAELRSLPGVRIGVGIVEPGEIDRINILRATHLAMRTALLRIQPLPDFALIDGRPVPGLPVASHAIIKGDSRCVSISAASIIAKVARDKIMAEYDRRFSGYGFGTHRGYGTCEHLESLRLLGPCPIHRRTFGPVANIINGGFYQLEFQL